MGIEKGNLGILVASALSIFASNEDAVRARLAEYIGKGRSDTRAVVSRVYDGAAEDLENLLDIDDPETLMDFIKKDHPEVLIRAQAAYPEVMQAGFGDSLFGLLLILLLLFGPKWVISNAFKVGAGGVKILRRRGEQEEGEVIAANQLPALNDIIGEIVQNADTAWNNLTPTSRTTISEFYDFLVQRFQQMRFFDFADAISLFKLGIKYKYLDIRIGELNTREDGQQLEEELAALTTVERTVLQASADNDLEITSVKKSATRRLSSAINVEIDRTMAVKGATVVEIRALKNAFAEFLQVPALHGVDNLLRRIKTLQFKLKFWEVKYNRALTIAGPGIAPPAAGVPIRVLREYEAAHAFIDLYATLQRQLNQLLEDLGPLQKTMVAIDRRLPANPGRRRLVKWAAIVAAGALTWWLYDSDSNGSAGPSLGHKTRVADQTETRKQQGDESMSAEDSLDNPWKRSTPDNPSNPNSKVAPETVRGGVKRSVDDDINSLPE